MTSRLELVSCPDPLTYEGLGTRLDLSVQLLMLYCYDKDNMVPRDNNAGYYVALHYYCCDKDNSTKSQPGHLCVSVTRAKWMPKTVLW